MSRRSRTAREAAKAIGVDLSDRRGIKWEWEKVDMAVREECYDAWEAIIRSASTESKTVRVDSESVGKPTDPASWLRGFASAQGHEVREQIEALICERDEARANVVKESQ
jgi:hypothetical protein